MATSNNDRVSSARLLDMLKGLQENGHLGSEPEVITETTQHTYVPDQIPRPVGTVTSEEAYYGAIKPTSETLTLPIYVYGPYVVPVGVVSFNECEPTILATINYSKEYTVNEKTFMVYGDSELPESYDDFGTTWNGFVINGNGDYWECVNTSEPRGRIYYFSDKQPVTEDITTTTKTKHTIKQDYLPNADWTQNDPDGEGYVQGRTHWVEVGEGEATVGVQTGAQRGNFAIGTCDNFGSVKGFTYPNGEYNPGRIGEVFEAEGMQVSYIGEDANGNAIVPTNLDELSSALSTTAIGIMLYTDDTNSGAYVAYPNVATDDICTVTLISENVHKLDRKFYDYVDKDEVMEEVTDKLPELVVGSAFLPMKYLERVLKDNPGLVRITNAFVGSPYYHNGGQLEFNIYALNQTLDDITYNTKFVVVFKGNRYGTYSTYVGNCILAYNCLMPPEMDQNLVYTRQSNTYIENVISAYASDREILINKINNTWCVFDANCEDSITNSQASELASVIFRVRQINYGNGTGRDELYITKQDNSKKLLCKGSGYVGDITCARYGTQSTGSEYGCEFVDLKDKHGNCIARLLLLEDVRLPNANAKIALNNRHLDKPFSRKFYWYNDTQYGEGTLTCGTNAELSFDNASATDNVNIVPILIPIM